MINPNEDRSPRPSKRQLISAALIGIILVAAIAVIAVRAGNGSSEAATPSTATGSPIAASSCGLSDGPQSVPSAAPRTNWDLNGKMAAPSSKSYGPAHVDRGVHSCFARNPDGAIFAAANFYTDALGQGQINQVFVDRWFIDGPAKRQAQRALDANTPADGREPIPQQIVGYRIDSYSKARTTVTLVTQETAGPSAGGLRATPTTVVWDRRDWRIDVDNSGVSTPTRIPSLAGFTPWSGVS